MNRNIDVHRKELDNVASLKMEWGLFNGMIHPCDSQGQTCKMCSFQGTGTITVNSEKIVFSDGCFVQKNRWLYKEAKEGKI